jgi:ATP-dependent DNA helicase RecG
MSITSPFEALRCEGATLADLDQETMAWFVARALGERATRLPDASKAESLLTHLEVWSKGRPANGAVLLFGRKAQKFFQSATIRCTRASTPASARKGATRETMKGTLFDLIDGALEFLESSISQDFNIPGDVLREALVNAVVHRDYASARSIEVNVSPGLVEIWNPGEIPPALTIDMLRRPHQSFPRNPRIAHCFYLARYTERIGTGTRDMIMTTRGVGLPVPQYAIRDSGFLVSFRQRSETTEEAEKTRQARNAR